ncbi:hypothetical protein BLAT2472_60004 [Burkholderia latens]
MYNQWNECGARTERHTDAPRGADRTPELLDYWIQQVGTRPPCRRDAANCGLVLGRESAEWDIN